MKMEVETGATEGLELPKAEGAQEGPPIEASQGALPVSRTVKEQISDGLSHPVHCNLLTLGT